MSLKCSSQGDILKSQTQNIQFTLYKTQKRNKSSYLTRWNQRCNFCLIGDLNEWWSCWFINQLRFKVHCWPQKEHWTKQCHPKDYSCTHDLQQNEWMNLPKVFHFFQLLLLRLNFETNVDKCFVHLHLSENWASSAAEEDCGCVQNYSLLTVKYVCHFIFYHSLFNTLKNKMVVICSLLSANNHTMQVSKISMYCSC